MSRAESNRLEFIESMRLLAACLVFFQHLIENFRDYAVFDSLARLGPGLVGVVIFFVVSGYVVPMSVRRDFDPSSFMIRRVFRVFPLLLFVFALIAIGGASGILARWEFMTSAPLTQWAANLLLVQDFVGAKPFLGVTWTLAIEFIWYSLFALALWRFKEHAGRVLNIAMPLAMLALAAVSVAFELRIPLGRPAMVYACVLGYQAYLFDTGKISARTLAFTIATFFAVTWTTNFIAFGMFQHAHISLFQALWPWTVGPLVFFAIILIKPIREARLLNSGLLPAFGAASYSIYMFHTIALSFADQHFTQTWLQIAMALLVTGLLSFVGYRYVELSGVELGRKVIRLMGTGRGSAAASPAS